MARAPAMIVADHIRISDTAARMSGRSCSGQAQEPDAYITRDGLLSTQDIPEQRRQRSTAHISRIHRPRHTPISRVPGKKHATPAVPQSEAQTRMHARSAFGATAKLVCPTSLWALRPPPPHASRHDRRYALNYRSATYERQIDTDRVGPRRRSKMYDMDRVRTG